MNWWTSGVHCWGSGKSLMATETGESTSRFSPWNPSDAHGNYRIKFEEDVVNIADFKKEWQVRNKGLAILLAPFSTLFWNESFNIWRFGAINTIIVGHWSKYYVQRKGTETQKQKQSLPPGRRVELWEVGPETHLGKGGGTRRNRSWDSRTWSLHKTQAKSGRWSTFSPHPQLTGVEYCIRALQRKEPTECVHISQYCRIFWFRFQLWNSCFLLCLLLTPCTCPLGAIADALCGLLLIKY